MAKCRAIEVVPYDPSWPQAFAELRGVLKAALGSLALAIEHVGSTSVQGLAAKPILDVDVVIESPDALAEAAAALGPLGYHHRGDLGVPGREAFGREDPTTPTDGSGRLWPNHHLYVCAREAEALHRHLSFRDHLRSRPDSAREYERLKRSLSRRHQYDIDAYSEGKSDFVEGILAGASR